MTSRLSVWLRPSGTQDQRLDRLIRRLASENDAPTFSPHVTLVGDAGVSADDAYARMLSMASSERTIHMPMRSLDHTSNYHRCVYFVCDPQPALMSLNSRWRELLEDRDEEEYRPHLSAVYGRLAERDRLRVISELDSLLPLAIDLTRVSLVDTSGDDSRAWAEVGRPVDLRP